MIQKLIDFIQLKLIWTHPKRAYWFYQNTPKDVLDKIRLANLKSVLKLVGEKSIFYRNKFKENPFNIDEITSANDLGDIYTLPKDLQTYPLSHFLCNDAHTSFETTGTTSKKPKRVLFSNREIEDAGRVGAAGLWHVGLRSGDRVASSFDYSFWVSGPTLKSSLSYLDVFHVEAGRIDPEEFYERIKPYGCNVVVADPGWLVRLSEIASKKGAWLMKFMMVGGENLSESSRRFIESVWQCKVLLSYGQTEAFGMIGAECSEQNGYHVNDMDLWVEIDSPDEEGYGELVYTTLRRNVMPVIRYKSGDITRIIHEKCSCGSPSIRLAKLRGRVDEMVVTSVGNITSWMVTDTVNKLHHSMPEVLEWQLLVSQKENRDQLTLNLEVSGEGYNGALKDKVLESMTDSMEVARMGIEQGLAGFEVKTIKPGELKGSSRKLKKIIDNRQFDKVEELN